MRLLGRAVAIHAAPRTQDHDERLVQTRDAGVGQSYSLAKVGTHQPSAALESSQELRGGQRQRRSIARALVKRPQLFLFDDCLSALDAATDARLRAALKTETSDAAVVIVAQRVSTIMHADFIVVLDEGQIAGTGTHRELVETCDAYKEIVTSQLGGAAAA